VTRPILPILPKPIFLFLTPESSDPCLGSLASLTLCTTHFYKNGTHVATRFLIQLQYICANVSGLQLNDIPSNMTAMRSHREGRAGGRSPYCTATRPILWVVEGTALTQSLHDSERLCWVLQMSQPSQDSGRKKYHTVCGQIWSPMGLGGSMSCNARNTKIHAETLCTVAPL
jgi:hypothetical protein